MIPSKNSSFVMIKSNEISNQSKTVSSLQTPINKINEERRSSYLLLVTENIIDFYKKCNGKIAILDSRPHRVLTNPNIPSTTNSNDNIDGNLIVKVNDIIESPKGVNYNVIDLLGVGTFGQVFRCYKEHSREYVALKVIKNIPAYYNQGLLEVKIVNSLNKSYDPNNRRHIVRLLDSFEYKSHVCLVFELLHSSLLDVLTQNQYRGLPLAIIQRVARTITDCIVPRIVENNNSSNTSNKNITATDKTSHSSSTLTSSIQSTQQSGSQSTDSSESTKGISSVITPPKSVSSTSDGSNTTSQSSGLLSDVKLIDFGSACCEDQTMFSYIQSRFYRAPEVLLGVPYNGAIDVWSFACVCVELYLGLPLFPGVSQHNQLTRIVEMFGPPPDSLIAAGRNSSKYFIRLPSSLDSTTHGNNSNQSSSNQSRGSTISSIGVTTNSTNSNNGTNSIGYDTPSQYRLKTAEEYARDTNTEVPVLKKYLRYSKLEDVIMKCSLPGKSRAWTTEQKQEEFHKRQSFLDFLNGIFRLHPFDRWTAKQAAGHPFITNAVYSSSYTPLPDPKTNERKLSYFVHTQSDQNKTKSTITNHPTSTNLSNSSNSNSSIPRPIQQQLNYYPPQLNSMASQSHQYSQNSMDKNTNNNKTLNTNSNNTYMSGFLPLDRRRLSDPTNNYYLHSNLSLTEQTYTNKDHGKDAMKNIIQEQQRPTLKRGQSVLPRRGEDSSDSNNDVSDMNSENNVTNDINNKRQNSNQHNNQSIGQNRDGNTIKRYSLGNDQIWDDNSSNTSANPASVTIQQQQQSNNLFQSDNGQNISHSYTNIYPLSNNLIHSSSHNNNSSNSHQNNHNHSNQVKFYQSMSNNFQNQIHGNNQINNLAYSQPISTQGQSFYNTQNVGLSKPYNNSSTYINSNNNSNNSTITNHHHNLYGSNNNNKHGRLITGQQFSQHQEQKFSHQQPFGQQTYNTMLSGSYMPTMSYSMMNNVGGIGGMGGGSMQEGKNMSAIMTDFGQALLRPDMDERRRLQSSMTDPNVSASMQQFSPVNVGLGSRLSSHQYTPSNSSSNSNNTTINSRFSLVNQNQSANQNMNQNGITHSNNLNNGLSHHSTHAYSYAGISDGYMTSFQPSSSNITDVSAISTTNNGNDNNSSSSNDSNTGLYTSHSSSYHQNGIQPNTIYGSQFSYSYSNQSMIQLNGNQLLSSSQMPGPLSISYMNQQNGNGMLSQSMLSSSMQHYTNDMDDSQNNHFHSNTMKISASYHNQDTRDSYDDNPLLSGKGFEHILDITMSSPLSDEAHEDNMNNMSNIDRLISSEAELVADWDPFFQVEDIPNQARQAPNGHSIISFNNNSNNNNNNSNNSNNNNSNNSNSNDINDNGNLHRKVMSMNMNRTMNRNDMQMNETSPGNDSDSHRDIHQYL